MDFAQIPPGGLMKLGLVNIESKSLSVQKNKDVNSGYGTTNRYGSDIFSNIIGFAKRSRATIPVITLAYIQAIAKSKNHSVKYFHKDMPDEPCDVFLVYGSIVDYKTENKIASEIKKKFPTSKVGFCGPFPTAMPSLFNSHDFLIMGEPESVFLYQDIAPEQFQGTIVGKEFNINDLPAPDFDGWPIEKFGYYPGLKKKPFLTLIASRGCPFSCGHYCTYGATQGTHRYREPAKIAEDIRTLIKKYGVKSIQFRDPTFGLNRPQLLGFIEMMKREQFPIEFGIETRMDLLTEALLADLKAGGLRNLNVGVETVNPDVASINKRVLVKNDHQEKIIGWCNANGVNVCAFYIIGLPGDTEEGVLRTIEYAKKLNTTVAQFSIATPFPGTKHFDDLKSKGLLLTEDFEEYTQYTPVFKHDTLSAKQIERLKSTAFRKYYFRPAYILKLLKSP